MLNYFIVFVGAGLGGVVRYWGSDAIYRIVPVTFPYGTLAVNVVGSFIIGLVMYYFHSNQLISAEMRVFLTTGFCGGLTTFSTFSFETINLIKSGELYAALLNMALNVFLTLLVLFIAYKISKLIS